MIKIIKVLLFYFLFFKWIKILMFWWFSKIVVNQQRSLLTLKLLVLIFKVWILLWFINYFDCLGLMGLLFFLSLVIYSLDWNIIIYSILIFLFLICSLLAFSISWSIRLVYLIVVCYKDIGLVEIHIQRFLICCALSSYLLKESAILRRT